ncbi:MAG: beta-N-acetylhexosaminidase [Acidimicrobiales bacterium]
MPRFVEYLAQSVTWRSPLRVAVSREWRAVIDTFADDLNQSIGWIVQVIDPGMDCDVEVVQRLEFDDEEFRLSVDSHSRIEAASMAGVAYALTVLRQLAPLSVWSSTREATLTIELPRVHVHDFPRFSWRGVHLDVARHFFDVASVCRLIDQLSAHRLNRLHLHLNDDQGWRVEVPAWPRLSEVGSLRRSSPLGHNCDNVDDNVMHGGFYTASDLEVIRRHAAKRFIEIVPEIDLPGHAQAAIAAYVELGNGVGAVEVWTRWGISEHVLNVSTATLDFAEEVVTYVAGLFPGSAVHIGGDECPTNEWESDPNALDVLRHHGFNDARQLQGLFTTRVATALQRRGHEVLAWDEVLDADVPEGTSIVAWRSVDKGVEAAQRGHAVIMAPMEFLYFDWLNSSEPTEPVAIAPPPMVTSWEKVYQYSVVPPNLDPAFHHCVRGAQAQLWTEYIATRDHLDYMAYPRLCAFSEVVWGTSGSLRDFRLRLEYHLQRLAKMGIHFRPLDPVP